MFSNNLCLHSKASNFEFLFRYAQNNSHPGCHKHVYLPTEVSRNAQQNEHRMICLSFLLTNKTIIRLSLNIEQTENEKKVYIWFLLRF